MADFNEILEKHGEDLKGVEGIDKFGTINEKLQTLGYDVLINHKEKAEFVPSSRLGEIASQRDQFKSETEKLNQKLQEMKEKAEGNKELQNQLQDLMNKNDDLLGKIAATRIDSEIIAEAKDAIDARDILPFINRDKLKINAKDEVVGVKEEVERIRTEKPHLFGKISNKGGKESSNNNNTDTTGGMNFAIRRAAGRL